MSPQSRPTSPSAALRIVTQDKTSPDLQRFPEYHALQYLIADRRSLLDRIDFEQGWNKDAPPGERTDIATLPYGGHLPQHRALLKWEYRQLQSDFAEAHNQAKNLVYAEGKEKTEHILFLHILDRRLQRLKEPIDTKAHSQGIEDVKDVDRFRYKDLNERQREGLHEELTKVRRDVVEVHNQVLKMKEKEQELKHDQQSKTNEPELLHKKDPGKGPAPTKHWLNDARISSADEGIWMLNALQRRIDHIHTCEAEVLYAKYYVHQNPELSHITNVKLRQLPYNELSSDERLIVKTEFNDLWLSMDKVHQSKHRVYDVSTRLIDERLAKLDDASSLQKMNDYLPPKERAQPDTIPYGHISEKHRDILRSELRKVKEDFSTIHHKIEREVIAQLEEHRQQQNLTQQPSNQPETTPKQKV